MTRLISATGTVTPVTLIQAGPCTVTQVRTMEKDGYNGVQIGFGLKKEHRTSKAMKGHLKDLSLFRWIREERLKDSSSLKRGDVIDVDVFEPGTRVQIQGTTKGRGTAGTVKRHGFAIGPRSHGSRNQRRPGSIGTRFPQHTVKGRRMAGHYGDETVTTYSVIVDRDPENHLIAIKGAIPGAKRSLVVLKTPRR